MIDYPGEEKLINLDDKGRQKIANVLAAACLESRGYRIINTEGYKCPDGSSDIVAFDPEEDCVVLIDTQLYLCRTIGEDDEVLTDMNEDTKNLYRRVCASYLMDNYPQSAIRYDLMAVKVALDSAVGDEVYAEIEHMGNVFGWHQN